MGFRTLVRNFFGFFVKKFDFFKNRISDASKAALRERLKHVKKKTTVRKSKRTKITTEEATD